MEENLSPEEFALRLDKVMREATHHIEEENPFLKLLDRWEAIKKDWKATQEADEGDA